MSNRALSIFFFLFIFANLLFSSSCEEAPSKADVIQQGCIDLKALNFNPDAGESDGTCSYPDFFMNFNFKVGTQAFHFNTLYRLGSTQTYVRFEQFQFYVSGISLERDNGSELTFNEQIILVTPNNENYKVSQFETGKFYRSSFYLGLDKESDDKGPMEWPADHPLNNAFMWQGDDGGGSNSYRYVAIRGLVSVDGDDVTSTPLQIDLSTQDLLSQKDVSTTLNSDTANESVYLEIDVEQIFEGIDLSTQYNVNYADNPATAEQIMDNFITAIQAQ